jgi:outer membrane protein TolC
LPIFDWGQAKRELADSRVVEARHKTTQVARTVVEEVRRGWASYKSAQGVVKAIQNDLVPLQDQRRSQAETQYRNGAADISTLLLAEEDALASNLKLVQAQSRVALAYVRLARAAGGSFAVKSFTTAPAPATAPTTISNP